MAEPLWVASDNDIPYSLRLQLSYRQLATLRHQKRLQPGTHFLTKEEAIAQGCYVFTNGNKHSHQRYVYNYTQAFQHVRESRPHPRAQGT
jgi:hypothetical protein